MSIASIQRQERMISLESGTLSSTFTAVTDRLPGFVAEVNGFLKGLFELEKVKTNPLLGNRHAVSLVSKTQYTTLMPLPVSTPPGLSVSYDVLVKALEESEEVATALLKETLQPFNRWLALNVASPERLQSLNGYIDGVKLHDVDRVTESLKACFKNPSSNTSVSFGEAFRRSSDFASVANDLNKINDAASRATPQEVRELIKKITGNLDLLIKRVQNDPENYKPSGPVIKALSTQALAMAKECEFYSVFQYQLKSTIQAFKDSEDSLSKVLTES